MQHNRIVSREEWIAARVALLAREKELTRLRDRLSAERRALPWVRVEKPYVFDTVDGPRTLADLFAGRSQLLVQHFMFGPGDEAGCIGCSFYADHLDAAWQHLRHHDVSVVAVARARIAKLEAYRRRMGWRFPFVSSGGSDFNYDFDVSFRPQDRVDGKVDYNYAMIETEMEDLPGTSVFYRDEAGTVFHTYSQYARGGEEALGAYMLLDLTPRGRNETGPYRNLMDWARRHDEYAEEAGPAACCGGAAAGVSA